MTPPRCVSRHLAGAGGLVSSLLVATAGPQSAVAQSLAPAAAHAMGHSFEVHCRSCPWASTAGTIAAFERASWALRSRREATASA
jgi:hypothetical protein